jgi:hypothetical protein
MPRRSPRTASKSRASDDVGVWRICDPRAARVFARYTLGRGGLRLRCRIEASRARGECPGRSPSRRRIRAGRARVRAGPARSPARSVRPKARPGHSPRPRVAGDARLSLASRALVTARTDVSPSRTPSTSEPLTGVSPMHAHAFGGDRRRAGALRRAPASGGIPSRLRRLLSELVLYLPRPLR